MALTYNPRGSTAYLYATEVIPRTKRLSFATFHFTVDGFLSIITACYFFYIGDVNIFFAIVGIIFTIALIVIQIFVPETPSFLLATGDTEGFTASIQKFTG